MEFATVLYHGAMVPVWLVFSYVLIAVLEWAGHAILMHRDTWLSRRFKYFEETVQQHRNFHHGHCFPGRRFDLRRFEAGAEDQCFIKNIDLKPLTGLMASVPIWGTLLWFYPVGGVIFITCVIAHHSLWGVVHRQMHTPRNERAAWFRNSPFLLWLARYHCLHHIYPKKNHSILFILPDFLFGTYYKPTEKDIETMRELQLYPEQQQTAELK